MPFAQLALSLISYILEHAQVIKRIVLAIFFLPFDSLYFSILHSNICVSKDVDWRYQCLVVVNIVCFFFGMWAFNILTFAISSESIWSHYSVSSFNYYLS